MWLVQSSSGRLDELVVYTALDAALRVLRSMGNTSMSLSAISVWLVGGRSTIRLEPYSTILGLALP